MFPTQIVLDHVSCLDLLRRYVQVDTKRYAKQRDEFTGPVVGTDWLDSVKHTSYTGSLMSCGLGQQDSTHPDTMPPVAISVGARTLGARYITPPYSSSALASAVL